MLYKKYIKNVTINLFTKELKILKENEFKYNIKCYSKINTKNNLFEDIVDKLEFNNELNSIESLSFSFLFIETINAISSLWECVKSIKYFLFTKRKSNVINCVIFSIAISCTIVSKTTKIQDTSQIFDYLIYIITIEVNW